MQRKFHSEQPESFEFSDGNLAWARKQLEKYPDGRQAAAIIPLLWRAQKQEGWLTRPAVEYVADMLGLAHIRAYEVASFYFMFQLRPVGSKAHIQICGTTCCMICGAEDLIDLCRRKISPKPHQVSPCGRFSWEEVECLGACANAPMVQIGSDYYEDLSPDDLSNIVDEFGRGRFPAPGSRRGRYSSEPEGGPTSLAVDNQKRPALAPAVALAMRTTNGGGES
ncbi:MAG: NADH-quinone oxidoreductase subunit NuoE [Rhodobacteraceae bacterium]|nr:NADH-quinone oxidoreductase subunit NuoE [Paracoccaceae bacterium]